MAKRNSPDQPIVAQASRLLGPHNLVFEADTIDPASLGEEEILCATEASAISPGTEIAAYKGLPPLRPTPSPYPRLVGYMNVGRVLRAGSRAPFKIGERVLTFASHRSHYIVDAAQIAARVPDTLDSHSAAIGYLFHLAANALDRVRAEPGRPVVVIGLGAIGLCAVALAAARGSPVYALSAVAAARERAVRLGAVAYDKRDSDVAASVRSSASEPLLAVVITSNGWADWRLALEIASYNASIGVLGFPGRGEAPPDFNPLDSRYLYDKQLAIRGCGIALTEPGKTEEGETASMHANVEDALRRLAAGQIPADVWISGRFPAVELEAAYQRLLERDGAPVTFILSWDQS